MKKIFFISLNMLYPLFIIPQEIPVPHAEQQLENLTDAEQAETEDDSYYLQLELFRKHPINLNTAGENDLKELKFLSGLQIENFLIYRKLLGKFISIFELQTIPSWDIETIKKLLPFITVAGAVKKKEEIVKQLRNGEHSFLTRFSRMLEKSKGYYDNATTGYLGRPLKIFFRYRYQYKNLLQYGITGDKDAGEQFFRGAQKQGFDFYSFHLFSKNTGIIQALAIGDFTINMGQGLIQWQSLAFRKSADVINIKRQSAVLRPYQSAGEFNFHRGLGISFRKGNAIATVFVSRRKLSANILIDSSRNEKYISSFITSGYHRTENEIEERNKLQQLTFGGSITYKPGNWHIGVNAIHFTFSLPVQKRDEPYNLFAFSGRSWSNVSMDYSFTHRNLHFFGEAAADKNFSKGFINGIMISVDPRVDISLLHRTISRKYQSINGNAFAENIKPSNETGCFAGICIRPAHALRIDAYLDVYRFPWLKYFVDAPGQGKDFLVELSYIPNKQVEIYSRYRTETKPINQAGNLEVTNFPWPVTRRSWRTQLNYSFNSSVSVRNRVELLWYGNNNGIKENGYLAFFDFFYKPFLKPYSGNFRIMYFETGGYGSRIYAYENDVLFYHSIPAFFDKGFRYYINLHYNFSKNAGFWVKWSKSVFRDKEFLGSAADEILGSTRSEIRLSARIIIGSFTKK